MEQKYIESNDRVFITTALCGCKVSMMFTDNPMKPVKNVVIESPCNEHRKEV